MNSPDFAAALLGLPPDDPSLAFWSGEVAQAALGDDPFGPARRRLLVLASPGSGARRLADLLAPYGVALERHFDLSNPEPSLVQADPPAALRRLAGLDAIDLIATADDLLPLVLMGEFPQRAARWTVVRLARRDKLAQAVTLALAARTGRSRAGAIPAGPVEVGYDAAAVHDMLLELCAIDTRNEALLASLEIGALLLDRSEILATPADVAKRIAEHAGVSADAVPVAMSNVPLEEDAELNAQWTARYRTDIAAAILPRPASGASGADARSPVDRLLAQLRSERLVNRTLIEEHELICTRLEARSVTIGERAVAALPPWLRRAGGMTLRRLGLRE